VAFQPEVNQQLVISGTAYSVAEHPAARGMPYGQEGRAAVVYRLTSQADARALKVFKPRHRVPGLVSLARRQAPFADLPGLQVCSRTVLTPQQQTDLLRQHPDLTYGVLMPWVDGPTWMEVMLEGKQLSRDAGLSLARSLAMTLATMEQEGLAHCDLSGPNLLLPALAVKNVKSAVELVDVEQMYGPDLPKSDLTPAGSPGYGHKLARQGLWSIEADRFAGAVLLAEILGWCDERVRDAAWGESYFDPEEMQTQGQRYTILHSALNEHWGETVARLLERAWESETLDECPTFGDWLVRLPGDQAVAVSSVSADSPLPQQDALAAELELIEASMRAFMQRAEQSEAQGDIVGALSAYRQAQALAPEGSGLWQELELICQQLERVLRARERMAVAQVAAQATNAIPDRPAAPAASVAEPQVPAATPVAPVSSPAPAGSASVDTANAGAPIATPPAGMAAASMPSDAPVENALPPAPYPSMPMARTPQVEAAPTYAVATSAPTQSHAPAQPTVATTQPRTTRNWAKIVVPTLLVLVLLVFGAIALSQLQGGSGALSSQTPDASATPASQPTGVTAQGTGQAEGAQPVGLVGFRDSAAELDEVIFSASKLPMPGENKQYEGWLLGADGERRLSVGVIKLSSDGGAQLSYKDREGTNLLSRFDSFEVTVESHPDSNPQPSDEVAFSGSLPRETLVHVAHLLIASEDTPNRIASCVGLLRQTELLNDAALDMVAGQRDNDLARVKSAAEAIVNIIEGEKGERFGDRDSNGMVYNPGDGFGILLNGTNGYIQDVLHHAKLSTTMADASDNMRNHGEHVILSANNASAFAVELRDVALRIAVATSISSAESDIKQVRTLANQVLNGKDINGDEKIDHIPGEAAVESVYHHAQYMADIQIYPSKPGSKSTP